MKGKLFLCLAIVFCMAAPELLGQDESVQKPKGYFAVKPAQEVDIDQAVEIGKSGAGLLMWKYSQKSSRNKVTYMGTMVGLSPFSSQPASSSVATQIIPLIIKMTGPGGTGTATFDPTVADTNCLTAPNDVPLTLLQQSPIIQTAKFKVNGVSVGTTQYTDAFQQANFWSQVLANHNNFHTMLSPVTTLAAITVNVPTASGLAYTTAQFGGCATGTIGVMDINWFDPFVTNTLLPALVAQGVHPSTFPIFLMYNVVMSVGTPNILGQCCILGYHGTNAGNPVQTYSPFDFDGSKVFGKAAEDISIGTHEVAEWMDDPLGNNPVPAWGHIGQQSGCQNNLEVGDPLTGTQFPPVTMPNGFIYHPQELAFFSWFYGAPSIAAGGDFSDHEKFEKDAGPVCH
jgi:hypothetical protein